MSATDWFAREGQEEDSNLVVVGFMHKDFPGHKPVGPCLSRQLEFIVQIKGSMLVDWQGFGQPKVCELDGTHVIHQRLPECIYIFIKQSYSI